MTDLLERPADAQQSGFDAAAPERHGGARGEGSGLPRVGAPGFAGNSDIFFAAVALTRLPMLVTDPNLPDNPVAFANHAFCALTGYAPDELIGRNCRFLQGSDTDPATVARIRAAVQERHDVTVEILNYRRDGSPFWNALAISPVFAADGRLQYFFASQLDVSRRREAERALAQAQRLDGLGALAGGVAHEFNNLLTVMRGNLEPLLRSAGDARTAARLGRVRDAAERAALLTRSMVSFARRQRLDDRRLELGALLRDLRADLARIVAPQCDLVLDLPDAAVSVRADPEQLRTALINIMLNARDAMPDGGRVRLCVALRQVGEARPPEVELSVADSGRGMPPHVAARAIDPFFTTKQSGEGAGLGLSMAYGFMRQTGGRLELTSREGEGTVVRMVFPGRPALPPMLPRGHAGETVLLVDEDLELRLLAVAVLEDLGYTVHGCATSDDALACAAQEARVNLLLTDTALPGMAGAELGCRLQALHPEAAVLFSSVDPAAGQDAMAKPFGLSELAWRVRDALDRTAAVSSG
jgi:PAS domain S-box-containing protein